VFLDRADLDQLDRLDGLDEGLGPQVVAAPASTTSSFASA
jgi:hypothetical protein